MLRVAVVDCVPVLWDMQVTLMAAPPGIAVVETWRVRTATPDWFAMAPLLCPAATPPRPEAELVKRAALQVAPGCVWTDIEMAVPRAAEDGGGRMNSGGPENVDVTVGVAVVPGIGVAVLPTNG